MDAAAYHERLQQIRYRLEDLLFDVEDEIARSENSEWQEMVDQTENDRESESEIFYRECDREE